jgi:selenocysteine lyase/cysteine desulfurase
MINSRRSFLGGITGAAAGLTWLPAAAATTSRLRPILAAVSPGTEGYWKLVREQFPCRSGKIMMNAANLCPAPRVVSERVTELTRDEDSDVSFPNRAKFSAQLEESRTKVADQLGVSADEIALVRNTSEANNVINNGCVLKPGDEVLIWDQNHPCNNVAWDVRAVRFGFTVKRVSVPAAAKDPDEVVKLFEAAMTKQTKVLSITYISNTSGFRLPARQLCSMAHQRGAHCHVDGAQTWGFLNLNLSDIGCDSYAASAHKWLMGPKQVGVLYVRKERHAQIVPNIVSVGWGSSPETTAKGARKFEALGQREDGSLSAVGTAVDFHRMLGFAEIEARTMTLAGALKMGLAKINRVRLVTPADPRLSGGVVVSQVEGFDRQKMSALANELYTKYGIAGAATGGLRLCPHIYNTMDDVEQALRGVRELLA